jgi:Fe-S cluster biosynthesis and repair protein YggX
MTGLRVGNLDLAFRDETEELPFQSYEGTMGSINIKISKTPWGLWTGHLVLPRIGMIKTEEFQSDKEAARALTLSARSLHAELSAIVQTAEDIAD